MEETCCSTPKKRKLDTPNKIFHEIDITVESIDFDVGPLQNHDLQPTMSSDIQIESIYLSESSHVAKEECFGATFSESDIHMDSPCLSRNNSKSLVLTHDTDNPNNAQDDRKKIR